MTDLLANFRLSARNNRYANAMIAKACTELGADGAWAKGVNFFPSIGATLNHILAIDRYYLDALEEGGRGRAIFDEDGVAITDLKASDTNGTAVVDGRLGFRKLRLEKVDFKVDADSFPLRQEGSIVARLDGNARMIASFEEDGLDGEVRLQKLELDIPESSATPQDLAPHPEVFLIGETYEPIRPRDAYRVHLKVRSEGRLVIRSRDQGFFVEATANFDTTMEEELILEGTVNLHTGSFRVFGKRFEVRSGSMVFDGKPEIEEL